MRSINEVTEWLREPEVEIDLLLPSVTHPKYIALVREFQLRGEGDTVPEAYRALTEAFDRFIEQVRARDDPLPDRHAWAAQREHNRLRHD
jgi:hypothetical protein